MTHEAADLRSKLAKAEAHVHCGACGAELPAVRTKAQQRPDSPEMKVRIYHVRIECPARRADNESAAEGDR